MSAAGPAAAPEVGRHRLVFAVTDVPGARHLVTVERTVTEGLVGQWHATSRALNGALTEVAGAHYDSPHVAAVVAAADRLGVEVERVEHEPFVGGRFASHYQGPFDGEWTVVSEGRTELVLARGEGRWHRERDGVAADLRRRMLVALPQVLK